MESMQLPTVSYAREKCSSTKKIPQIEVNDKRCSLEGYAALCQQRSEAEDELPLCGMGRTVINNFCEKVLQNQKRGNNDIVLMK